MQINTALDVSGAKVLINLELAKNKEEKVIYNCVLLMETTISSLSAAWQDEDICNTLLIII